MLHLVYIFAFTILAFLAVGNLIRSLVMLSSESRTYPPGRWNSGSPNSVMGRYQRPVPHPELLDASGNVVNEPLMVMKSMTMDDARERLDALYEASPGGSGESKEEK
jgi:hypothetical protein